VLLEQHFEAALDLPLLPDTAAQVIASCNDESCSAHQLSALIARDPSLAGHVLRVANSTAYAPKEPIVSLQQAVSRLGMGTMCEISVAVSLQGKVFRVPGYQQHMRAIWRHSAAAGAFAKEAARLLRRNVESAFLCGLLHDVGRPVVLQGTLDIWRERMEGDLPAAIAEAAMDDLHAPVGALLAQRWGMATWMSAAIRRHHDPQEPGEHEEEARMTCLADLLAHWALAEGTTDRDFAADHPVLELLNLYPDDVARLLRQREKVLDTVEALR
jgi:putative nucleotidyltransferase with HDIG domain